MVKPRKRRPKRKKDSRSLKIALAAIAIILFVLGPFYYSGEFGTPRSREIQGEYTILPLKPNTHEPGKVKMTVFFDFYCPHCYTLHKNIPELKNKYGERLEIIEIGYPLGESSYKPIEAYELAKEQGKGEEMKDALFRAIHADNVNATDIGVLLNIASTLELDKEEFEEGLKTGSKRAVVESNKALGDSYNIEGTPTVIFDGQILTMDSSPANLEKIIESLLEWGV